jgi:NADH-quinone oxidoreductase subunit E
MQGQLNEWLNDINKIKREKEIILEDVIEDIGKIDKIIQCHDSRKNNLIQILLDVQEEYNWLPKHALLYVGSKLNIPLTNIYGIASFYKYFNLEPRGKHSILVCMGTACHIRGSMNLIQRIVNILGVKPGDTTRDYKFTLDTVNCLGCCALGPVVMVDNKYYSNPSTREIKKIFGKFN